MRENTTGYRFVDFLQIFRSTLRIPCKVVLKPTISTLLYKNADTNHRLSLP